jgi:hypothetical protein
MGSLCSLSDPVRTGAELKLYVVTPSLSVTAKTSS